MATGTRGDKANDVYLFRRLVGARRQIDFFDRCFTAHFTQISRLAVDRVAADHRRQLPVRVIEHAEHFDPAYPPIQVVDEALGVRRPTGATLRSRQLPTQVDHAGGGGGVMLGLALLQDIVPGLPSWRHRRVTPAA
jgi:hypothetical protein